MKSLQPLLSLIFSIQEEQSIRPAIPQPCVEIQVLPKKFEKPIKVIAFIDTGAQKTMMDPDILPEEYWEKSSLLCSS